MTDAPARRDQRRLLAVDLGLRTGLALFDHRGRLLWSRSHNLGKPNRLRRAARSLLSGTPGLQAVVLEGGGPLADIWQAEARKLDLTTLLVSAEEWREKLLLPRERIDGATAKRAAQARAAAIAKRDAVSRTSPLRHDAAEAVLVGLYGLWRLGWVAEPSLTLW